MDIYSSQKKLVQYTKLGTRGTQCPRSEILDSRVRYRSANEVISANDNTFTDKGMH